MANVTLTGNLGSGKSTVCKLLEKQGYEIYSTGKVIRAIADDMGISVLEMNELMTKDHKYDHMIDEKTAAIGSEEHDHDILFDSRLAWHFVAESFKVFLSVDLSEAARRVYNDASRGEVETYKDVADAKAQLAARAANEDARYEELYGIHYFDFNNYNMVLDTSFLDPEHIAEFLMIHAKSCVADNAYTQPVMMFLSPKRLGMEYAKEINFNHGYVYPKKDIRVTFDGELFKIVSGEEYVKKAAEEGYAYVQVTLA